MNETQINAILHTDVKLTGRRGTLIAPAGLVLKVHSTTATHAVVGLGRMTAAVSLDDASTVVWNSEDLQWQEG